MRLRSPRPRLPNDSLLKRLSEALTPRRMQATEGATLHFEAIDLSARGGQSRIFSVLAHAALLGGIFLLFNLGPHTPTPKRGVDGEQLVPPIFVPATEFLKSLMPSEGIAGNGGEHDFRPPTAGELAPFSKMPLAPPRIPQNRDEVLPVPPAVFDPNAPEDVTNVKHLGVPWMKLENDSAGMGEHHGIGIGPDGTMGDQPGGSAGRGDDPHEYANVLSMPACQYCPSPAYTDQARKQKIQGRVMAEVLVGADGRAHGVRVLKGLGLGLDENTVQTIGAWRFAPAKNAQHQAIAVWVTIESVFRLY